MNLIDWMDMSIIVDVVFVIFAVVAVLKIKKLEKELFLIRSDLDITMKNPQAAKRLLKRRQ